MALVLLQGEDAPHAPDMGGVKFNLLLLENVGEIINQRIMAPGDKECLSLPRHGKR